MGVKYFLYMIAVCYTNVINCDVQIPQNLESCGSDKRGVVGGCEGELCAGEAHLNISCKNMFVPLGMRR